MAVSPLALLAALPLVIVPIGPGTEYYDGWPPVRFRGEARVTVQFMTRDHLQAECGRNRPPPPGRMEYKGCTRGGLIFLPLPVEGEEVEFARVTAHEVAHNAFGWDGRHPL